MEEITKHYLISGRVQGVGFRAFTQRLAREFALRGWVRNLSDGRVEAMAQGSAETIRQFEAKLKTGPSHGHVESLLATIQEAQPQLLEFVVRKDSVTPCSEK